MLSEEGEEEENQTLKKTQVEQECIGNVELLEKNVCVEFSGVQRSCRDFISWEGAVMSESCACHIHRREGNNFKT